jgi:hypothetical protein
MFRPLPLGSDGIYYKNKRLFRCHLLPKVLIVVDIHLLALTSCNNNLQSIYKEFHTPI